MFALILFLYSTATKITSLEQVVLASLSCTVIIQNSCHYEQIVVDTCTFSLDLDQNRVSIQI